MCHANQEKCLSEIKIPRIGLKSRHHDKGIKVIQVPRAKEYLYGVLQGIKKTPPTSKQAGQFPEHFPNSYCYGQDTQSTNGDIKGNSSDVLPTMCILSSCLRWSHDKPPTKEKMRRQQLLHA